MARKPYTARRRWIFRGALLALLCQIATWAPGALAEAPATQPALPTTAPSTQPFPAMRQWFADLANPDGDVRDQAVVHLMGLHTDDLPAFRKLVEESRPLAPEQLVALKPIVTQVFLANDPYAARPSEGFLGIHLPPPIEEGEPAVVVDRIPGFVGARVLRDGDIILGILERPEATIRTSSDLIANLREVPLGVTLHLQIMRQGRVIRVAASLDPRPVEADTANSGGREAMDAFLRHRNDRAEAYWQKHFADLIDEAVS